MDIIPKETDSRNSDELLRLSFMIFVPQPKSCAIVGGATGGIHGIMGLQKRKEESKMRFGFVEILLLLLVFPSMAAVIYVIYLLIKALRKYTKSEPVRRAKAEDAKTLGEVLKKRRMDCKMTQEFVAETLGVSRQAVSKWESGASDPSTTNLMALAKLFGTTAEELLKETK